MSDRITPLSIAPMLEVLAKAYTTEVNPETKRVLGQTFKEVFGVIDGDFTRANLVFEYVKDKKTMIMLLLKFGLAREHKVRSRKYPLIAVLCKENLIDKFDKNEGDIERPFLENPLYWGTENNPYLNTDDSY